MSKKSVEYFDPKTNKYPYPEDTDKHYLRVKKDNGLVFDEKYPYIDKRKSFRFVDFFSENFAIYFRFPSGLNSHGFKSEG